MLVKDSPKVNVSAWDELKCISYKVRKHCPVCLSPFVSPLLDLPGLPLTELYCSEIPKEKVGFVDQEFHFCHKCSHGSLTHVLDPQVVYGPKYSFRSSTSQTAVQALDYFLNFINKSVEDRTFDVVIEVGCSDLNLLKKLRGRASRLVGIDPVLSYETCHEPNCTLIGDLVENVNIREISEEEKCLIVSSHTLEHLSNPKQLIEKLLLESHDDTIFCFQFPGLESLVDDWRFDQIFHQHLNYFSLHSFSYLLGSLGAELLAYDVNYDHWGTLLVAFQKKKQINNTEARRSLGLRKLQEKDILRKHSEFRMAMVCTNQRLKRFKDSMRVGYGASLMLPVLSYYLGDDLSCLDYIIDDDLQKTGQYYANMPVSIKHSSEFTSWEDSVCLLTSVASRSNVRPMLKKLFDLKVRDVIVPLSVL
ncbi:methyltransferase domain-containing protein [Candidatus Nitrospira salsa]|nr:MAG: methyltransferase [Nitrospirales bacterium]